MQNGLLIGLLLLGAHASASQLSDAQDAYERGDFVKAIEILGPMAEAGDVDALGNLGNMYAFGQGVPQDFTKAAELWSKAAEKGLGTAMGNMAKLYSLGLCSSTRGSTRRRRRSGRPEGSPCSTSVWTSAPPAWPSSPRATGSVSAGPRRPCSRRSWRPFPGPRGPERAYFPLYSCRLDECHLRSSGGPVRTFVGGATRWGSAAKPGC